MKVMDEELEHTLGGERTIGSTGQQMEGHDLQWKEMPEPDYDAQQFDTQVDYQPQTQNLGGGICPNCGAPLDADADFCEVCKHYVRADVCSFCGSHLDPADSFCPECGNQRGGIVCPQCHSISDFAFCKHCGAPVTEEARMLTMQMHQTEQYRNLQRMASEMERLSNIAPLRNEEEKKRQKANEELRERVLRLLAEDKGITSPVIEKKKSNRMTQAELDKARKELEDQLTAALDTMATEPSPSPVKARNYSMAVKPSGVKMGWVCNYKHALHSSPCGCAKPQLGGKWVILGHNATFTSDK